MSILKSFNLRTKRPVMIALAITLGGATGLVAGQSRAADVSAPTTPAPVPSLDQRVHQSFERAGPYVGVRGGFGWLNDTDFEIGAGQINTAYEDWNLTGSAFAGYEMEVYPGFAARLEAELGYSSFAVVSHTLGGVAQPAPAGDTAAFTGMVNAYLDAKLGRFRPFVGGGLGLARVRFDDHSAGGVVLMDDEDTNFAWQVSGGVGYALSDRITLEGLVRYQTIADVSLTSTTAGGSLSGSTDLESTSGLIGLRYHF